jgi:hypothetical protein
MTAMSDAPATDRPRWRARGALALAVGALALSLGAGGCGTGHPKALGGGELSEAETFPYYTIYWVGPSFIGFPLAAADGLKTYISSVGDSVYYGDCVRNKGIFGSGSCQLPLQVTTVIYHLHGNVSLGTQRNILVRGVPAVVYDEGRSIELYTGRVAIDIFSDSYAHAVAATAQLRPLNAPGGAGAAGTALPLPVYCPGLAGPQEAGVEHAMQNLPGRACQRDAAAVAFAKQLTN